ncbi:MAG: hypothetical protein E7231_00065 [Cellulosilyticum sp.]|nr:hypothetical protein [Cellulosilyticum sp.]
MHKFKRVEIEAFRVYNERQIFDFTYKNDVANFVVIYGPNGFGKTSFNDAIEWGITGEIARISNNKVILDTAEYEKGEILKNRESKREVGEVLFVAEDESKWYRVTTKIDGRTKKDYQRGSESKQGEAFKKMDAKFGIRNILAHEQIDSFLKATTPEKRYQELIPFWDEENTSKIYVNICNDAKEIAKEYKKLHDAKKTLEQELSLISFEYTQILDINGLIREINSGYNTNLIEFKNEIDEEQSGEFIRKLIQIRTESDAKEKSLIGQSNIIQILLSDYNAYQHNTKQLQVEKNKLEDNIKKLAQYTLLEDLKKEVENEENRKKKQEYKKAKYNKLVTNYNEYKNIKSNVVQNRRLINEKNINLENEKHKLKMVKIEMLSNRELIEENEIQLKNIVTLKTNIENSINQYKILNKKSIYYMERLNKIDYIISVRNSRILQLQKQQKLIEDYITKDRNILFETENVNEQTHQLLKESIEIYRKIKLFNNNLQDKENEYFKAGELCEDLNKIVKIGERYVGDTKESVCPLCKSKFASYEYLLEKIQSNFNSMIKIDELKVQIEQIKGEKEKLTEQLDIKYENFILGMKKTLNKLSVDVKLLEHKNAMAVVLKNTFNSNLSFISSQFLLIKEQFYKEELYDLLIANDYNGIREKLLEKESNINKNKSKLEEERIRLKELEQQSNKNVLMQNNDIEKLNLEINSLINTEIYIEYLDILRELQEDDDVEIIKASEVAITEEYNKINIHLNELLERKSQLEDSCKLFNRDELVKEKINLEQEIKEKSGEIKEYISKYHQVINKKDEEAITSEKLDEEAITSEKLDELKKENIVNLNSIRNLIKKLEQLLRYKEVIDNNIMMCKKKQELMQVIKSIDIVQKVYHDLQSIKSYSSQYIQNKINEVFNSNMINYIYSRIEPHPQLTEISFHPDFSGDKPQIHIYTKGDNVDKQAPVLFLSSAQLNILSLSIFYARALQNTDTQFKTIFMDDPVEHFDDMNILSFIDLIRSIIVQLDTQIIMSTHDERLYNLLKRKLDPQYYKSKFIELESYGKIKR